MIISGISLKKLFKFIYLIYFILLSILDVFLFLKKPKKRNKKNILFIKLDRFGDFVLWNEHFNKLIKYYSDSNIYLVCRPEIKDFLNQHYKKINFINVNKYFFLFDVKYRYMILSKLRNFYFDQIINFHRERDIYFSDMFSKIPQSQKKIGNKLQKDKILNRLSNLCYDILIPTENNTHESAYLNKFTDAIIKKNVKKRYLIKFKKNKKLKKYKDSILIAFGGTDKKKTVSLDKILSSLNFKENKKKIILAGNSEEFKYLNKNYFFYEKNIINLTGKTNFDDFIYLHFLSKIIISNDSVSGHLAHHFKKVSYTFLGGGHFKRFFPYPISDKSKNKYFYKKKSCFNCNWNCIYDNLKIKKYPCIEEIEMKNISINI